MSKFLRSNEKRLINNSNPQMSGNQMNGPRPMNGPQMSGNQMNGPRPMNGPQMNGPQMNGPQMNGPQMNGPRPMNGPQMNGPQMNGPQMNGPQMNGPRPMQQFNNSTAIISNQLNRPIHNNNFRPMNLPNAISNPRPINSISQPIINPNQMNTGMLNMNNTGMLNLSKINNPSMIQQQSISNFNPMTTGMLNLNTGEFLPTPQMSTGMLNLNTGEFIPTPQNTGMLNLNTGEFIPTPVGVNTGMISPNVNPGLIQRNNPFFDPSMNTYEFNLNENQNLIGYDNSNKNQIDLKLDELQRMYNSNLISDEEYLIKKRDLVKKALDNL